MYGSLPSTVLKLNHTVSSGLCRASSGTASADNIRILWTQNQYFGIYIFSISNCSKKMM